MLELDLFQDDDGIVVNVRFCPEVFGFFADASNAGTIFKFHSNQNGSVTIEILARPGCPSPLPN
ncbi:MAG: hypothetical protein JWO48_1196 [Bryobacterales bacterium]|nr:hypothetical protein [Bryobacterales bacterium]